MHISWHGLLFFVCGRAADDNCHLQNSAELSKVLVDNDITFQSMYYTDGILFLGGFVGLFNSFVDDELVGMMNQVLCLCESFFFLFFSLDP